MFEFKILRNKVTGDEYNKRRSKDAKSLEAIIINNNFELPWGKNATIDDIADWFDSNSQF